MLLELIALSYLKALVIILPGVGVFYGVCRLGQPWIDRGSQ